MVLWLKLHFVHFSFTLFSPICCRFWGIDGHSVVVLSQMHYLAP